MSKNKAKTENGKEIVNGWLPGKMLTSLLNCTLMCLRSLKGDILQIFEYNVISVSICIEQGITSSKHLSL